jgi:hypothetical protein
LAEETPWRSQSNDFEIRYAASGNGGSGQYAEFELTILDPKRNMVLLAVSETVNPIKYKCDKESLERTLANVVTDAKKLLFQGTANTAK